MTSEPPFPRLMTGWITACLLLVVLMVAIGGLTRLSESGLSIVEWKLVSGILPPLTESGWTAEFAEYQTSPQYRHVNSDFAPEDFKRIYWLEYVHRLLGRLTGLVFFLPLVVLRLSGRLRGWLFCRMGNLTLLVGLQGVAGWTMVQSGLVDDPRVAPLRLALHLGLAALLFGGLLLTLFRLRNPIPATRHTPPGGAYIFSLIITGTVFLQILLGALVAGLDAGLTYNTFPLMDGRWIPEGLGRMEPWVINHMENITTVQFQHRVLAWVVALAVLVQYVYLRRISGEKHWQRAALHALLAVTLQFSLGVATLLYVVPTPLAMLHQVVAFALLGFCLRMNFMLYSATKVPVAAVTEGDRNQNHTGYAGQG